MEVRTYRTQRRRRRGRRSRRRDGLLGTLKKESEKEREIEMA